jgi:hypothetical protein
MKNLVLAALLVATVGLSAVTPVHAIPPAGVKVTQLPADGCRWDSLFFLTADWRNDPRQREFYALFQSDEELRNLINQTTIYTYGPHDRDYRTRYAALTGGVFPTFILQTHDGKLAFKVTGPNAPVDPTDLRNQIIGAVNSMQGSPASCFHPFRNKPTPPNQVDTLPPVPPTVQATVQPIQDTIPKPAAPPEDKTNLGTLILIGALLGGIASLGVNVVKKFNGLH